ncbi:MAG TPA: proline--tRNA ligase [Terriglobales bacterium]|nr:proline--tRNA ligase [Terriglobales bacterium]
MHYWSKLFIPTLREAPADAEVASHKFLLRGGYVRQLAAGIYSFLFLGHRAELKIIDIVRQEMDKIGQEFYLPAIHPRELWEASGRWSVMGDNMFRLKDRKGAEFCLGFTEEEVMTEIARKELRSYKQLPQIWYQIQAKFRDEPRPKSGLLRVRQFTMKDSYSFDLDAAGLDISYQKHYDAYCRIFDRCRLNYVVVEAHSGAMGGSQSHEFMVYTDAGEDLVVSCPKCKYAANIEKATSRLDVIEDYEAVGDGKPVPVHTPGLKTVEEVANFLGVSPKNKMKTMALMAVDLGGDPKEARNSPVIAFLRGDHQLNEAKLVSALPGMELRPMHPEEIQEIFRSPAGFLGPVTEHGFEFRGVKAKVLVDRALLGRKNLISGANKEDYHLRNVTPGRDFHIAEDQWADLRAVEAGEGCPNCGTPLVVAKAVEIGHIFKLGCKYSESMGARVLDKEGKEVTPIMGSYGIGIERILTAAIEQNHDERGFWLPPEIAPFHVIVVVINSRDKAQAEAAETVARQLERAGLDVLLDDRDERPGVKFNDADLIGVPARVIVGKKAAEGVVELVRRSTGEKRDANISAIAGQVTEFLR